jgi:hypothetical protein
MKALLLAPVAVLVVLSFVTQLADVASSTSEKTLNYASEMDSAVDCAFRGIPVSVCSPELTSYDFEPDAVEYMELNREYIDALKNSVDDLSNSSNITVVIID